MSPAPKRRPSRNAPIARRIGLCSPGTWQRPSRASPARDAIDVAVIGPDGEVDLRGTLRPEGPGSVLTLRTYGARPLAAVDGVVREDGLVLNIRAVISGVRKAGGDIDPAAA